MVNLTEFGAGAARLVLAPELGGGIARLDLGDRPVLRPWDGDTGNPFSLASNILVPFSNRISGGGFEWAGERYELDPNLPGESFPIHGDGFQKHWAASVDGSSACLALDDGAFGPWLYSAKQTFNLTETGLNITLNLTNTGPQALPFGAGFHPWFPRNADTRLSFAATGVWMEDEQHLPTQELSLGEAPMWDFSTARYLPKALINNAYTGWSGVAKILQGVDAVSCKLTASNNLDTAIVYSPNESASFFCFEPVSHPVNALHLSGHPGLKELVPGQSMQVAMSLSWRSQ